ncbi:CRISPR-associated protein Csx15 [Pseudomonas sp. IT-P294]|uniref:CRISPR-associated protein Csx15 n=1 Tax=Pseudomonas sp. IT-P294 TaxID=3026454 RepID=UPI0039E15C20
MNSVLINFSGHSLNQKVIDELTSTYDKLIDAKPIEITFDGDVEKQIHGLVESLPVKIDGSFSITIIPPGQATFAILLVSYLHGLIGHFPNLCYLERSNSGIYIPKTEYQVQPQEIRSAGRKFRYSQHLAQ